MYKKYYLPLLLLAGSMMACQQPSKNRQLADTLLNDTTLQQVDSMARAVLAHGFNAGSGYSQVWARDLNTFIETACEVNDPADIRWAILLFFRLQQPNDEMVDGYVLLRPAVPARAQQRHLVADDYGGGRRCPVPAADGPHCRPRHAGPQPRPPGGRHPLPAPAERTEKRLMKTPLHLTQRSLSTQRHKETKIHCSLCAFVLHPAYNSEKSYSSFLCAFVFIVPSLPVQLIKNSVPSVSLC